MTRRFWAYDALCILATIGLCVLITAALAELTGSDWNVWVSAFFGLVVGVGFALLDRTRGRR